MERDTVTYPTAARGVNSRSGPPHSEGLIDEATNEIRNAASDLGDIAHALRDHLDLTLGHNPQPGNPNGVKSPESPVRADQLRASLGNLNHVIAAVREQVERARQI